MEEPEGLRIQYFKQYLTKGVRKIFDRQRSIAEAKIYGSNRKKESVRKQRSGALKEALEHPSYMITERSDGVTAELNWPIYIRFLDMKRHGNYKIYNRQVWGIIYKETFTNMRYEYRQWLEKTLNDLLEKSINQIDLP